MMRYAIITTTLSILLAAAAGAQTFTSVQDGYWHDPATWDQAPAFPDDGDDVIVLHNVIIEQNNSCRDLTVAAGASVRTTYGYRELIVHGDADIQGDLYSAVGGWPLDVTLHGDLTLGGTLTPQSVTFIGGDHHINLDDDAVIAPRNMWAVGSQNLIADTDLRFDTDLDLSDSAIVLTGGNDAAFLGGFCQNGTITAGGNAVISDGGAYLGAMTISNAELRGRTRIYSSAEFTGTTTVTDTLQSHFGQTSVNFDDLLVDGLVQDGGWPFDATVLGDLVLNSAWTSHLMAFGGAGISHTLTQADGTVLAAATVSLAAETGRVTLVGHIILDGHGDLNQGELVLSPGAHLTLAGGDLGDGRLVAGGGEIISVDGSFLLDLEVVDAVLQGVTSVYDNVIFSGETMNEGVLRSVVGVSSHATVDGDIVNHGSILDNTNNFYLDILGDMDNLGVWTNTETNIIGTVDQWVGASDTHPVGGILRLHSHLGGTGHQWTLNETPWLGFVESTCALTPAGSAHQGLWRCSSSAGTSRAIYIGQPGATGAAEAMPALLSRVGSWPNPFNPATEIHFTLGARGRVRVAVYDLQGRLVVRLTDGELDAGTHALRWNAEGCASGTYLYRIDGAGMRAGGRCMLIK